jgi:hypothetical protein
MIDQNTIARLQQIEDNQAMDDDELASIRDELTDLRRDIRSTRRLTFITVLICVLTIGYVGHIATKAIANAAATVAQMEGVNDE